MADINSQHISHLGRLARIDLTNEERERFAGQLASVVQYVEQLEKVDTSSVTELKGVTGMQNIFAEDALRSSEDPCKVEREALLQGAPAREDNFIAVRAVMGDEVVGA